MSKVSVIIPTYKGAAFLGEAIQSVLDQTYPDLELIVVNDGSPDNTTEVVGEFVDPRLKYFVHETNRGVGKARHTGLQSSSGEIIAFLDQDDFFHPEKLQAHVEHYKTFPDVGFTYNARFELNYSSKTIRDISRPPKHISLADLVLWFPLSPSDVVLRKEWAQQMDMLNSFRGAEITHFGRLYLDGCKFGCVDRALNFRRYHSGRKINNLVGECQKEINNQIQIFSDPRCPPDALALRGIAHANIYMYWAYLAYAQNETSVGQEFVREAVREKPSILQGMPCELLTNFLINCIDDEGQDHEIRLRNVFSQLPPELVWLSDHYAWAVAQGYLLKGARALIWGRFNDGRMHFERAINFGAQMNESFISTVTSQLVNYEIEFGAEATEGILASFSPYLLQLGGRAGVRRLNSTYMVNSAFHHYRSGDYRSVRENLIRAILENPKYLTNRGVLAVLKHSIK